MPLIDLDDALAVVAYSKDPTEGLKNLPTLEWVNIEKNLPRPKDTQEKLSYQQKEIIVAMARCDLTVSRAAKELYRHRKNVDYHVCEIVRKTGLDPRKFYDMIRLLDMVEKSE